MQGYHFLNVIDEQNRFVRLKVYNDGKVSQEDSHTISYLGARKLRQEMGQVMGFDRPINTIDDYVATLTPEDRKQSAGIIEQCKYRDNKRGEK